MIRCHCVPAHDSTSLYLHFRALGRPFLWAAYFRPSVHAGSNECGSFAPVLFLFALHCRRGGGGVGQGALALTDARGVNRIKSDAMSRLDEVFRLLEDRGEDASEAELGR